MEQYEELVMHGMPITILVILAGRMIAQKMNFDHSIQWIRIILLIQAITTLITLFYLAVSGKEPLQFTGKFHSPYYFVYMFMVITNTLLPLILIRRQYGKTIWILFVIGLLMNFARIIESLVIILTSYHRDVVSFIPLKEIETITKGLLLGIVMIVLEYIIYRNDKTSDRTAKTSQYFKFILIAVLCVLINQTGSWLISVYGLDPPYGHFYTGTLLQYVSLTTFGLLILSCAEIFLTKRYASAES